MDTKSLLSSLNLDSKGFKQLLDTQSLVDCTLACEGGKISAHKVVLSACSSYLAKILQEHPVEHPIIILPELNIEDVKTLVHYMYTGDLLKTGRLHSSSLLRTAGILSVNSLNDFLDANKGSDFELSQTSNRQSNGNINNSNMIINDTDTSFNGNFINVSGLTSIGGQNQMMHITGEVQQTPKSDFQFKCPACQNDFQTICSFEYHMQRVHSVTSFGCEICHKPFASLRYVLTDHMRRCHSYKLERQLQC